MPRPSVRVGVLTALYRRQDLARVVLRFYRRLRVEGVCLTLHAVGSEAGDRAVARECGWSYNVAPNEPLSDKYNAGARSLTDLGLDALVVIGSDNLLTREYFEALPRLLRAGTDLAYFSECHLLHVNTRRCFRLPWPYVGAGRMLSRRVLDAVGWKPWPGGRSRLLDQAMMQRIQPHVTPGAWHGFHPRRDADVKVLDLKADGGEGVWTLSERLTLTKHYRADGLTLMRRYWPREAAALGLLDEQKRAIPMPLPPTINEREQDDWELAVVKGSGGWKNKAYGIPHGTKPGQYFWGPRRWIEEHARAHRAAHIPLPGPEYEAREVKPVGPAVTKPAGPSLRKRHAGGGWYDILRGGEVVTRVRGKAQADAYIAEHS